MSSKLDEYIGTEIDAEKSTCLYDDGEHKVFWLGIDQNTPFRCNVYLIKSGNEAIVVDPGSREFFENVKEKTLEICDVSEIKAIILCHQDPDVSASMIDWLDFKNDINIMTTNRTNVLLPHYGRSNYNFFSVNENNKYEFSNGRVLEFIEAPFLHFPGAFTTLDKSSNFLFSGDIWAALDINWTLVVDDFGSHSINMDLFSVEYFASNIATRGFVQRLDGKDIEAILPQHGSIINEDYVEEALEYLKNLKCGTDIIYEDLS